MHSKLVVIGGGPGGYAAAFLAADHGIEVTIVEAESRLGGTCLLRGCIPSKALLHAAKVMSEVEELSHEWGIEYNSPKIALEKLRDRKNKVISTLSGGLSQLAKRRKVNVIHAHARFSDSKTLQLDGDHESITDPTLTFDHCIIATGSIPAMPPAFDIGSDRVMDSTGALDLADIPESMLVIGGGYIGLEMGSVYAGLGTKVSVVELMDGLLMGADRDLVKPLQRKLKKLFEDRIFLDTKVGSLAASGDAVEVTFEGPSKFGTEKYDRVLVSVGRRPNTFDIGIENTAIKTDKRGFIACDAQMRATGEPNIFVIGDAAGEPMLAHKATHEGRLAVEVIAGEPVEWDKRAIPAVVFTDPEIAWAGITEEEAKTAGREIEVCSYPWAASGRGQAIGVTDGLTKWIIDPETEQVLGCGIVGSGAGELIAEATLAIEMGCVIRDVTETVHAHPTLSETVMNAGEVFYGTATEIYKPKKKPAQA